MQLPWCYGDHELCVPDYPLKFQKRQNLFLEPKRESIALHWIGQLAMTFRMVAGVLRDVLPRTEPFWISICLQKSLMEVVIGSGQGLMCRTQMQL